MDVKRKFKITLTFDENTETKLWSGKCTWEEMDKRFHDAIAAQMIKYNADHKSRQLRAYDEMGMIIAQETFHGK